MPGYVKPAWPVWQPGHPLGNGLKVFFAASEPADATTTRDAVSGLTLTAKGGAKTGQGGLICDAAGKGFEAPLPASLRLPLPFTIACQIVPLGTPSSGATLFGIAPNNVDASPWTSAQINCDGSGFFEFAVNSGGSRFRLVGTAKPGDRVGSRLVVVGVATTRRYTLYLDGAVIGSLSNTFVDPTYTATALISAGSYTGVNRNPNGVIEGGAIWNRAFSPGEVVALTDDFFAPVRTDSNLALWAALAGGSPTPFVGSPAAMMMGF